MRSAKEVETPVFAHLLLIALSIRCAVTRCSPFISGFIKQEALDFHIVGDTETQRFSSAVSDEQVVP